MPETECRRIPRNTGGCPVIGVTGGIGSGKTQVCNYLREHYRLPVIDLDAICRHLLEPKQAGWSALRKILPEDFFHNSGAIDRAALRDALFSDTALRSRVDGVLHPLARSEMNRLVCAVDGPVLVEIPLLFEAGWQDAVQVIVVVYADLSVRLQRITRRDRVSEEQALGAVAAQRSLAEKTGLADYVIDNSAGWENTRVQLDRLILCSGRGRCFSMSGMKNT